MEPTSACSSVSTRIAHAPLIALEKQPVRESPEERMCRIFRSKIILRAADLDGVDISIAQTTNDLEAAFRLVHDTYVSEGYMDPQPGRVRLSVHNSMPEATVFIVKFRGEVVAAMSILPDSFAGMPLDALYRDDIVSLRRCGRRIAEIGQFAVKAGYTSDNPTVALALMSAVFDYGRRVLRLDDCLVTVHPKHSLFYRSLFFMEQIGGEKQYASVKGNRAVLLRADLLAFSNRCRTVYANTVPEKDLPAFMARCLRAVTGGAARAQKVTGMSAQRLIYFFERLTCVFSSVEPAVVERIRALYSSDKPSEHIRTQAPVANGNIRYSWPVLTLTLQYAGCYRDASSAHASEFQTVVRDLTANPADDRAALSRRYGDQTRHSEAPAERRGPAPASCECHRW